jgi:hypothetical protein
LQSIMPCELRAAAIATAAASDFFAEKPSPPRPA